MILILLNFMPTTGSNSISLKKKFDMPNAEYEEYNDFPYVNDNRDFYDIKENQLQNNLPEIRSYSFFYHRILHDRYRKKMSLSMQNDLEKIGSSESELKFEALIYNGDYTPHDPIYIYSDEDFTFENGVAGGSGTENDPYIIEGWEIDSNNVCDAIHISYTTSYFIVRNCLLKNNNDGVYLQNLSVGSVRDCQIIYNERGIGILFSSNIVLRNNHLYDNDYNLDISGLEMSHYYHDIDTSNTVDDKTIFYAVNESGLLIDENDDIGFLGLIGCEDILVSNVTVCGVLLAGTSNSIISSSTIVKCLYGIDLFESFHNTIKDCELINSSLRIVESPYNVLRNNSVSNTGMVIIGGYTLDGYYQDIDTSNTVGGKPIYYLVEEEDCVFNESEVGYLALVNCKNIVVENVKVSNNWFGMVLACTEGIIRNCETLSNWYGLFVFGDCKLEIHDFKTYDNLFSCGLLSASNVEFISCDIGGWWGCIFGDSSHDVTIRDCTFKDSLYNAVILENCWDFNIKNNMFSIDEGINIVLSNNCWKNTVCGNTFKGSTGIMVELGSHNIIRYNKMNNLKSCGIFLYKSNDNIIHHNNIRDIDYEEYAVGIDIYSSEGNRIYQNNIYNNLVGLEARFCTEVNAINNWWGSKDGPSGIGPGSGDSIKVIEATVLYEPWLKRPVRSKNLQISQQHLGFLFLRFFEQFPILQKMLLLL